ncbi:hypothetical protein [Arthrobacter nitrophenolicus]|uniref:Lipoprotein n=1 Tax=Arthrobacter nitrophenolicus TaxID=683150 RepID=A0A4R5XM49_9MICC|nr:hypothetical protein [Arthrobacter nitrophenolicus]TDL31696.1 hypothetical protein E2R57_20845 [Arthrobacter nitrophenolicus]
MRSARRVIFFLAATASAALSLTGCMANASAGSGGTATGPASQSAPAPQPALPGVTTSPATTPVEEAAPAAPPPSSASASAPAASVTYTFPDGRLSLSHPAGWRVAHSQGVESPSVENATVYDAAGIEQIRIFYSEVGGAVAGPLTRTVFFSEPVPGLQGQSGPADTHASFYVDNIYGELHYKLSLTAGAALSPDGREVADASIIGGNRILMAGVVFTGGPFASDEAAKAWFAGAEGQALKDVLMSFSYR